MKVEYRVVSFLDRASDERVLLPGGQRALRRGRRSGPDAFKKFHDLLYENQPAEGAAGPDDDQLVDVGRRGGRRRGRRPPGIEDEAFEQWVVNATDQWSQDGYTGTPTVLDRRDQLQPDPGNAVLAAAQ